MFCPYCGSAVRKIGFHMYDCDRDGHFVMLIRKSDDAPFGD